MNREDAVAYLRAESACLVQYCAALRKDLIQLGGVPFDAASCATYCHKLRAYRGLLANHALAIRWMTHPPRAINASSLSSSSQLLGGAVPQHREHLAPWFAIESRLLQRMRMQHGLVRNGDSASSPRLATSRRYETALSS